jgi:hypothetical protein
MQTDSPLSGLAHTIQLSVAPVFVFTGVGSFLNVLTNRLARIIDRTRALEATRQEDDVRGVVREEMRVLRRRTDLINRAIGMCTYCALLVAGVVGALFVGEVLGLEVATVVAFAFVAAMIALILGLTSFLSEVHLATRHAREQATQSGWGTRT